MPDNKPPNPIYERFTCSSRWPSMRQSRWLAMGLVLACTALMVFLSAVANPQWVFDSLILPSGLVLIFPVILSVYVVSMVHQLTRSHDYRLIRLTPLDGDEILGGFTQVALFRLRVPRAMIAGLAPVIALLFNIEPGVEFQPGYIWYILTIVFSIEAAVVIWIAQWMCISYGVRAALNDKPRWRAILVTVLLSLIMTGILYFVSGFFILAQALWTFFVFGIIPPYL